MKTELLALATANLAAAQGNLTVAAQLLSGVQALPDDVPRVPTGLRVVRTYGGGETPLALELTWDPLEEGASAVLEVKGAPGNPSGPDDWTNIALSGAPGPNGEWTTYLIFQPGAQTINFRLRACFSVTGVTGEGLILPFTTTVEPRA